LCYSRLTNRGLLAPFLFFRGEVRLANEIDIPESAREPKPWFPDEPTDELVAEIKAFVKGTGTPYLWRGHTHTKPEKGALIRYKGEFDLPASHSGQKNRVRWSPCPCCKQRTPWFYKDGKIAWFPEDRLIRLIGPDCFKAINAQGHKEAEELFRAEQERKNTERFLLNHIGLVPEIIRAAEENLTIIKEVDRMRAVLSRNVPRLIGFDLWQHIRADGVLKLEVTRTERRVDRGGNEREVTVQDFERYGPIQGGEMLRPDPRPMASRVEKQIELLKPINFSAAYVGRMNPDERKAAVKRFKAVGVLADLFSEAEVVRRFLSPISLGSLNGWGKTDNAPTRMYIALSSDHMQLKIGKTPDSTTSIAFRPHFFDTLRALPEIAKSIND
jgi:hypothetical protein